MTKIEWGVIMGIILCILLLFLPFLFDILYPCKEFHTELQYQAPLSVVVGGGKYGGGVAIQKQEYDYVFGSRKVVKDINNPNQKHYYETDIWSLEGKKLEGLIPENFLVFGELIGWTVDGKAIQSGYTYNLPKGECRLFVYRVAFVNAKGFVVDLTWDQVKEFCSQRGLSVVPELWRGKHSNFKVENWLDKQFYLEYDGAIKVDAKMVDEGVCIRIDRITPAIYKAKGPKFFEHETQLLDSGEADIESSESV